MPVLIQIQLSLLLYVRRVVHFVNGQGMTKVMGWIEVVEGEAQKKSGNGECQMGGCEYVN